MDRLITHCIYICHAGAVQTVDGTLNKLRAECLPRFSYWASSVSLAPPTGGLRGRISIPDHKFDNKQNHNSPIRPQIYSIEPISEKKKTFKEPERVCGFKRPSAGFWRFHESGPGIRRMSVGPERKRRSRPSDHRARRPCWPHDPCRPCMFELRPAVDSLPTDADPLLIHQHRHKTQIDCNLPTKTTPIECVITLL